MFARKLRYAPSKWRFYTYSVAALVYTIYIVLHYPSSTNAAADAVTDAVIAAPDAWRHLVGGGTADGATVTAGTDAVPSPPVTRSAMRAAAAAAAQLRASSG